MKVNTSSLPCGGCGAAPGTLHAQTCIMHQITLGEPQQPQSERMSEAEIADRAAAKRQYEHNQRMWAWLRTVEYVQLSYKQSNAPTPEQVIHLASHLYNFIDRGELPAQVNNVLELKK